jgi:hypothetical protein
MEVKNRKIYFKPYNMVNENHVVIMWDYKPIIKTNAKGVEVETPLAIWQEYTFNHIPSIDEIKNVINSYYNTLTNQKILNGFIWNGMNVWLSTENQLNYKTAYDLSLQTNGSTLPLTFKFEKNNEICYYEFKNIADFSDFYVSMTNYIQKTLKEGWIKKDSIDYSFFNPS